MEDLICHVCNAMITPLGQAGGVFCTVADCPGDRLSRFDVGNVCEPHPFCLSMAGERVEVKAAATPPAAVPAKKAKKRPRTYRTRPGLFD